MGLHNGALVNALVQYREDTPVVAITPHGTYEFDIVNVEGDLTSGAVLRLVERQPEHVMDRDCWCNPEVEQVRPPRWQRIRRGAR